MHELSPLTGRISAATGDHQRAAEPLAGATRRHCTRGLPPTWESKCAG